MLKLRDGKLHIFLRAGCGKYFYRFFFNGKYITRTTRTNNLALAKSIGENAYDSHRLQNFDPSGKRKLTWNDAVTGVLQSLASNSKRASRLRDYKIKFGVLREFFQNLPLPDIKERTLDEYLHWRRHVYKPVHANYHGLWGESGHEPNDKTIARDFDAMRKVLKFALREGVITKVPEFPPLSIVPTAKGWFEQKEMVHLIDTASQWIKDAATDRQKEKRRYCVYYLMFLWRTGLRVDECLCVTYQDVKPDRTDPTLCYITVRGGKLAYKMKPTQTMGLEGVINAVRWRRKKCPDHAPSDLIFPDNPRELVEELLTKAELLYDKRGIKRTAKSLRHTFIMERLRAGVSVFTLAKNCRTSVKQIEHHYGSYLTAEMARDELIRKRPRDQPRMEVEE
jgi:integrase